jgi:tetratricopeptide (TPR) repeat protein
MITNNKKVFISYKRKSDSFVARAIMMDLRSHEYDVFLDIESIDSGRFENIILNEVGLRDNFIAVISENWVKGTLDESDWCRRELDRAMELKKNVVPILINNYRYENDPNHPTLSRISRFNSLTLLSDYFDAAMQKLRERFLKQPTLQELEILTAEEYFQKAEQCREKENYKDAVEAYTEAVKLNPKMTEAFCNRSFVKVELGDLEGALEDLDQAILLDPGASILYENKGEILQELGRMQEAIDAFAQAATGKKRRGPGVDLDDPEVWNELGLY